MKIIISIIFITLFSINLISDEIKKTDEKQIKNQEQKTMTDDEFLKKFMKLDKEVEDAKAKTKALEKLEKTVDEVAKTLGVDK